MNTLENLYYGNIVPSDKEIIKGSKIEKMIQRQIHLEERLAGTFIEQQKQAYEKIRENHCELSDEMEKQSFIQGFVLGVKLMIETLQFDR